MGPTGAQGFTAEKAEPVIRLAPARTSGRRVAQVLLVPVPLVTALAVPGLPRTVVAVPLPTWLPVGPVIGEVAPRRLASGEAVDTGCPRYTAIEKGLVASFVGPAFRTEGPRRPATAKPVPTEATPVTADPDEVAATSATATASPVALRPTTIQAVGLGPAAKAAPTRGSSPRFSGAGQPATETILDPSHAEIGSSNYLLGRGRVCGI